MSHQTPQGQTGSSSGQGELFGRYRLRGILGQGGMGRLYVAEQVGIEGFSKVVALKRILPHLADSQHFREMFLNEARVAARLEHPNIVATFELGEVDGNYFISMEYLSGEDLASVLTRCQTNGAMPVEIAAALAQQSANGLHYAHEMRDPTGKAVELVHRDVSPLNIFVTYYGMVKLLDFGIVKGATDSSKTVPGMFKGKYAYCAPEQLDGGLVTRQTDIFCLGIVLWECLTGRRLFLRDSDAATIDAVRGVEIEPPSALRKDVPPELDQIVLQALSRHRSVRFGTAHAFSEALDRFLAKRENRPTSKSIGLWLESLFGTQRATLKKAIAQGSEVEAALNLLPTIDGSERSTTGESLGGAAARSAAQPRMLWSSKRTSSGAADPKVIPFSTTLSHPPGHAPGSEIAARSGGGVGAPVGLPAGAALAIHGPTTAVGKRPASSFKQAVVAAVATAAVVVGGVLVFTRARPSAQVAPPPPVLTTATLALKTEPPGAQIFVDGDPSGLTTPSVLTGLRPGRPVEIRLDKVGFKPVTEKFELKAGDALARAFRLVEATGTITLEGLPAQAMIYLDDNMVEGRGALSVAIGEHRIRIETANGVLWSQTLNVGAGPLTIQVNQKRGIKGR
jgi:serine/threonine protein kinase